MVLGSARDVSFLVVAAVSAWYCTQGWCGYVAILCVRFLITELSMLEVASVAP